MKTAIAVIILIISMIVRNQASTKQLDFNYLDNDCVPKNNRILGGGLAEVNSHQWMVLLDGSQWCGGSLITNRFVLSAAHCQSESQMFAILGEYTRYRTGTEKIIEVDRQIPHPEYNRTEIKNDIGLFRLSRSVTYDEFIGPICLPVNYNPLNISSHYNVSGWGKPNLYETRSSYLRTAELKVYDPLECNKYFRLSIDSSQICLGPGNGNTCGGDSGGPVTYLLNGNTIQIGLISYGDQICHNFTVHTNVYFYKDWVRNVIQNEIDIDYSDLFSRESK